MPLVYLLGILASATPLRAQAPKAPAATILPATDVNLVRIEVVVKERGRPRTGLRREDFAVFENGELQTIVQFQAFARPGETAAPVAACGRRRRGRDARRRAAAARSLRRARDRRCPHGVREPRPRAQGPRALPRGGPAAGGPDSARDDERRVGALAGVHLRPRDPAPDAVAAVGAGPAPRLDQRPHQRAPGGDDRGGGPDGPRRGDPGDPGDRHLPGRRVGRTGGEEQGADRAR